MIVVFRVRNSKTDQREDERRKKNKIENNGRKPKIVHRARTRIAVAWLWSLVLYAWTSSEMRKWIDSQQKVASKSKQEWEKNRNTVDTGLQHKVSKVVLWEREEEKRHSWTNTTNGERSLPYKWMIIKSQTTRTKKNTSTWSKAFKTNRKACERNQEDGDKTAHNKENAMRRENWAPRSKGF